MAIRPCRRHAGAVFGDSLAETERLDEASRWLAERQDQGRYWWEMQDPVDYWREFAKPKIVYQEIQFHPRYAFDIERPVWQQQDVLHCRRTIFTCWPC